MSQCPAQVSFASYGTPTGHCGESNSADFRSTSKCHAMKSEVWPERLAPRTSHTPHSRTPHASTPHAPAARCTLHTPRRTPHAARRTPHAARLFSPCGRSCWRSDAWGRPRACSSSTTTSSVATRAWASRSGTLHATLGIARWASPLPSARWLPPCRRAPHVHCMCACLAMHVQCALRVQAGCAAGMRRSSRGGDGGQGGQGQEVRPLGTRNAPAP